MPLLPGPTTRAHLEAYAEQLLAQAEADAGSSRDRIAAVSGTRELAAARLALATEFGFADWPALLEAVAFRRALDDRDLPALEAAFDVHPAWAIEDMCGWADHRGGVAPINYIAMLRFDSARLGLAGPFPGTDAVARLLLARGASPDGRPGEEETPLMTAASYGDADVAQVLIDAGARLELRASPDAGGVPDGTAVHHAAVFAMTDVLDALLAAGGQIGGLSDAAAAGELGEWLTDDTPADAKTRALIMAANHERLDVIEKLVAAGTQIDAVDPIWGGQPLWAAAENGRVASVRRLLELGADPTLRDEEGRDALAHCEQGRGSPLRTGHDEVAALLRGA